MNELQVNLAARNEKRDKNIAHAVTNVLKWDVTIPEDTIHVNVKNGEVTLTHID